MFYIIIVSVFAIQFLFAATNAYRLTGVVFQSISTAKSIHDSIGLVSRLLYTLHYPLLVVIVESNILTSSLEEVMILLRWLLFFSLLGLIMGSYYFDLMRWCIDRATDFYSKQKGEWALIKWIIQNSWKLFAKIVKYCPNKQDWKNAFSSETFPIRFFIISIVSLAFLFAGNYACLYAGVLQPNFRMTSLSLTGILNGVYSVVAILFIEMKLSLLTDQAAKEKSSFHILDQHLRVYVISSIIGSRLAIILLPFLAKLIVYFIGLVSGL